MAMAPKIALPTAPSLLKFCAKAESPAIPFLMLIAQHAG